MKKRKWFIFALLFLCCMGGCGKSAENEENADNIREIQVQEQEGIFFENGEPVERIIMEQSFEVELDGWEKVMFVSIAPEDNKGAPRFALAKEGVIVYIFPEDSYLKPDDFVEVSAVSFRDYNEDGKKDVIVLIAYRNGASEWKEAQIFLQENSDNMFFMDYPDLESYRREGPADKGPSFYRDSLLEEYLLTQRLTDTVASVMGTWADYIDYVDGLHGYISSDRQLVLLAEGREVWASPVEYADERYCFTVTDLDYDGLLEVIVANQGGTGHYTYSRFYEISGDGTLKELETSFVEGDSQPDILEEKMDVYSSFSPEGMVDHYIVYDDLRAAPDCYVYRISSLCMINDFIRETPLASQTVTYEGEDHAANIVREDCSGNALTEEEFRAFPGTYYSGMGLQKKTASFHWIDVSELAGKNDGEVEQLLRQASQGFQR